MARLAQTRGVKIHLRTAPFNGRARRAGRPPCIAHHRLCLARQQTNASSSMKLAGRRSHGDQAKNINPYLVDGPSVLVESRSSPISPVPAIVFGSMPNDGGHLLLTPDEKRQLLRDCPEAKRYVRRFIGSEEFINGIERWCLWLVDVPPAELPRRMKPVMERVEGVKSHRES